MVKKLFTLAFSLTIALSAIAQWGASNPIVSQSNIQFWAGTGSNRAVVAITWPNGDDNIGIAWGVQWNGSNLLLRDIMDTIAAYDSRLTITWNSSHSYINNLFYSDQDYTLTAPVDSDYGAAWWFYNWKDANGTSKESGGIMADNVASGDFVDWISMDPDTYGSEAADTMIMATDPNATPVEPTPEDAEIAASDILYWVGEGSNKVVFAINWADTALAWGYKFSTDSVYVSEIIDALVAADPRLSIEGSSSFISDFRYADENITDTLTITPHAADDYSIYFNMQVNHVSSMIGAAGHAVVNGDFVKFADTYVAVKADSTWIEDWGGYWDYTYVWPMTINPVSVPGGNEGITLAESMSVSVYPNPAVSSVNVSFIALEDAAEVELYDMTGRRVAAYPVAAGSNNVQIAVDGLANGVYLLRMADTTVKVIVR